MARVPKWVTSASTARVILSRLDGNLDLTDIAALTGVGEEVVEASLQPLVAAGLVSLGDETTAPPPVVELVQEPSVAAPAEQLGLF